MKIAFTGFPVACIPGAEAQKKNTTGSRGTATAPVGTALYLSASNKAVVRYMKAVEDITSDLLQAVDDGVRQTADTGEIIIDPDQLPRDDKAGGRNVFVCFSGSGSDGKKAEPDCLVILRGCLEDFEPDESGTNIQVVSGLAKETARQLSTVAGEGVGLKSTDIDSIPVREKLIAFAGTEDGLPAVSVVRKASSGVPEVLTGDEVSNSGISDIVTGLNAAITSGRVSDAGWPEDTVPDSDKAAGFYPDNVPVSENVETGLPSDFFRAAAKALLQAFPGADVRPNAETGLDTNIPGPAGAFCDVPDGGLNPDKASVAHDAAGFEVRYITAGLPAADIPAQDHSDALIVDKLMSLEKTLKGFSEFTGPSEDLPGEDRAVVKEISASIQENMPVTIRDALNVAKQNHQTAHPEKSADDFGIGVDEKGMLKIDRAAIAGALSEKRDETISYVRDFGTSFQDRLRYDFNPLAGIHAGGPGAAGIGETDKKKGTGGDDDGLKDQFEKRLNELKTLLESSYELKGLFMQNITFDPAEFSDETT